MKKHYIIKYRKQEITSVGFIPKGQTVIRMAELISEHNEKYEKGESVFHYEMIDVENDLVQKALDFLIIVQNDRRAVMMSELKDLLDSIHDDVWNALQQVESLSKDEQTEESEVPNEQ